MCAHSKKQRKAASPFVHALFFVLGFTVVFVLLGASATLLGRLLLDYRPLVKRVGSVLLVVFGMRLMAAQWSLRRWIAAALAAALLTFALNSGVLLGRAQFGAVTLSWALESAMIACVVLAGAKPALTWQITFGGAAGALNFLASFDDLGPRLAASLLVALLTVLMNRSDFFYSEKRFELEHTNRKGLARSFLFGLVFGAGWTPCIGPILAGILIVASQMETVGQGILLLAAYSLGLGIPFLLVGLAFGPLSRGLRGMHRYLGALQVVSGALLLMMGILLLTDGLAFLARYGSLFELEP